MHQPKKWRQTADPFSLPLREFKITEVLGYPHAGNDVFYVKGVLKGGSCRAYIKVERQAGADLKNEAETIALLPFGFVPRVIEYSESDPRFIVTEEKPGRRLSQIAGENAEMESLGYMAEYGRTLALFHGLDLKRPRVKPRRFFEMPEREFFVKHGLQKEGGIPPWQSAPGELRMLRPRRFSLRERPLGQRQAKRRAGLRAFRNGDPGIRPGLGAGAQAGAEVFENGRRKGAFPFGVFGNAALFKAGFRVL